MTNPFLEKIAFSVEDTRDARKKGETKYKSITDKAALAGGAVGGVLGGGLGVHLANKGLKAGHFAPAMMHPGITKGKIRAIMGVGTAIVGGLNVAGVSAAAAHEPAREAQVSAHTNRINKGLNKSAYVREKQVSDRIDRNERIAGLAYLGGAVGGGVTGATGVGAYALHKGMRESGGYAGTKTVLKNAYDRRKDNKEIKVGKGAYLTKLEDITHKRGVARYVDRPGIAKNVGKAFGRVMHRAGGVATMGGMFAGSALALHSAVKATDKSDVNHYLKLSQKNLRNE